MVRKVRTIDTDVAYVPNLPEVSRLLSDSDGKQLMLVAKKLTI
jgi:hypothetical protein